MNIAQQDTKIQAQIQAIKMTRFMSNQQKDQKVNELKSSKLIGTDTSTKTVLNITNTMIGSAVVVYPILFLKDGVIGSTLIMIVVGCIQFITCRLLVLHNRPNQASFNQSILRIGGVKVNTLNSLINMLLLFFVCIAYYLLIVGNFYQITSAIAEQITDYKPPDQTDITFKVYSMQWACILSSIICISTLFKSDIDPILKLMKYSIYCVAFYFIFILVNLIRNMIQGTINFGKFKKFDPDFSSVAGAFALSFLIHPTASPILKKSINPKNNQRDLMLGYILTACVYFYVGFIGSMTCGPKVDTISKYEIIFECFADKATTQQAIFFVYSKIVQAGILFQNFSVLPILFFLTRKQFISLVNKPQLNRKLFYGFTILFLISTTLVGVFNINVSLILSFDGAVVGFFMGYGIPIYIHLKCLFHKYTKAENQKRTQIISEASTGGDQSLISASGLDDETQNQMLKCNQHKPRNKVKTYIFYGFILFMGAALGVFKLVSFFQKK